MQFSCRKQSSVDDVMTMTIEFLRARLLSERAASRAAKMRVQQLATKVRSSMTFCNSVGVVYCRFCLQASMNHAQSHWASAASVMKPLLEIGRLM